MTPSRCSLVTLMDKAAAAAAVANQFNCGEALCLLGDALICPAAKRDDRDHLTCAVAAIQMRLPADDDVIVVVVACCPGDQLRQTDKHEQPNSCSIILRPFLVPLKSISSDCIGTCWSRVVQVQAMLARPRWHSLMRRTVRREATARQHGTGHTQSSIRWCKGQLYLCAVSSIGSVHCHLHCWESKMRERDVYLHRCIHHESADNSTTLRSQCWRLIYLAVESHANPTFGSRLIATLNDSKTSVVMDPSDIRPFSAHGSSMFMH